MIGIWGLRESDNSWRLNNKNNWKYISNVVTCLVAQLGLTLCDCILPGSSVRGFSRQEYWSGLPIPPPGNLPNPGIEPRSPALQADFLPAKLPGKPMLVITGVKLFLYFRLHKVICIYYLMSAHIYGINEMLLMVP